MGTPANGTEQPRHATWRRCLYPVYGLMLLAAGLLAFQRSKATRAGEAFARDFAALQRKQQYSAKDNRQKWTQPYEELIRRYHDVPQRAEAMFYLAHIYSSYTFSENIQPDYQQAEMWGRRARAAAIPGSEVWFEASFDLVSRMGRERLQESLAMLDEIERQAKGELIILTRINCVKISIYHDSDFATAIEQCDQLILRAERVNAPPSKKDRIIFALNKDAKKRHEQVRDQVLSNERDGLTAVLGYYDGRDRFTPKQHQLINALLAKYPSDTELWAHFITHTDMKL